MPPANLLNTVANSILNLSILINGLYTYILFRNDSTKEDIKLLALSIVIIGFIGLGLNIVLNAIQYAYYGLKYKEEEDGGQKKEITSLEDVFRYHRQKYGKAKMNWAHCGEVFWNAIMIAFIISVVIVFSFIYLSLGVLNSVLLLLIPKNLNLTLSA